MTKEELINLGLQINNNPFEGNGYILPDGSLLNFDDNKDLILGRVGVQSSISHYSFDNFIYNHHLVDRRCQNVLKDQLNSIVINYTKNVVNLDINLNEDLTEEHWNALSAYLIFICEKVKEVEICYKKYSVRVYELNSHRPNPWTAEAIFEDIKKLKFGK